MAKVKDKEPTYEESMMLSEYEQRVYKGMADGESDKITSESLVVNSLKKALNIKSVKVLDSGEEVEVSVIDLVVAATIKDAISDPNTKKLRDIAAITGELDTGLDVNITKGVNDLFGDIVNKDK